MLTKKVSLVIFFMMAILLVACGRGTTPDAMGIEMVLDVSQMAVGDTNLMVTLTDAEGNRINDAQLAVKGDMSHAGMEPVLGEGRNAVDGVYMIPFEWTMGGTWYVTVEATLSDGTVISQRFSDLEIMTMDDAMDHGEMEMEDGG